MLTHDTYVTNLASTRGGFIPTSGQVVDFVSPLLAISPRRTRVCSSSALQAWRGFLVEKHLCCPGERPATSIDRHVIAQYRGRSANVEYRLPDGGTSSCVHRPDAMTLFPAGPIPGLRLGCPAELLYCAFEEEYIREVAEELDRPRHNRPTFRADVRDLPMRRILGLLLDELEGGVPPGKLYVDSLAHALATRYLLLDEVLEVRPRPGTSALPPRILSRVREKIEANLEADLSLESLARESGYSRAHFLRMFSMATGLTPHQCVLDLRVKQAQMYLRKKEIRLVDVAGLCGFSSQSHMTTIFRKRLETSPVEFRRNAN